VIQFLTQLYVHIFYTRNINLTPIYAAKPCNAHGTKTMSSGIIVFSLKASFFMAKFKGILH